MKRFAMPAAVVLVAFLLGFGLVFALSPKTPQQPDVVGTAPAPAAPATSTAQNAVLKAPSAQQNWAMRCNEAAKKPNEPTYCEAMQRIQVKETQERLLEVALGFPSNGAGRVEIVGILPLGIDPTKSVSLLLDNAEFLSTPIKTCIPAGCIMQALLEPTQADALRKGQTLTFRFFASTGEPINLIIPLSGLDAVMAAIEARKAQGL